MRLKGYRLFRWSLSVIVSIMYGCGLGMPEGFLICVSRDIGLWDLDQGLYLGNRLKVLKG